VSKRLFGTDGIRGKAGEAPLEPVTVRKFGRALASELCAAGHDRPLVFLARDTRESGPWLRDAVAAGLTAGGARASDLGVLPTPGLAYLTREEHAAAGVMISASHNPFADNGLKVFDGTGTKLSDALEAAMEDRILDPSSDDPGESADTPEAAPHLATRYAEHLGNALADEHGLSGKKVVLDAGHGAAAEWAPAIYRGFGLDVTTIGCEPNGRNINLGCGSLHLEGLAETVRREDAAAGLAFDGDADRCLAVDARGREIDGDYLLYLLARQLKRRGTLTGGHVVATIMSNLWLEQQLAAEEMTLLRAPVGDKYVLETMLDRNAVLGGEQSGHIIYRPAATTGDGILTGLLVLRCLVEEGRSLAELRDSVEPCPQVLINVPVRDKPDLRRHAVIGPEISRIERSMEGSGRVVLRYSGTERKARVMVEGRDGDAVRAAAETLADSIRSTIGA